MATEARLFDPIVINGMRLKNRIGQAPILEAPDLLTKFTITDDTVEWFECRARGGAGLVMTGCLFPMILDLPHIQDGIARIAEAVQKHDAKLGVQIGMWGPILGQGPSLPPYPDEIGDKQGYFELVRKASKQPSGAGQAPKALSVEEIITIEDQLTACTKMLKERGVDCVELHCSHGAATICCSFISPYYNRRTDDYGGSWDNRLRFPTDTLKKMRAAVGPDYPLLVRMNANEMLGEAGITPKDAAEHIAPAFVAAGADCLDVSQGSITHTSEGILTPMYYAEGCFIDYAAAVKEAVDVPVIGVGRFVHLDKADEAVRAGKADIIHFGRQLIADPDTPKKYLAGAADEVRPCVACNEGCGMPCSVNYDIGADRMPLTVVDEPKRVVVVGGGVAGMEAARVARLRGHEVILLERRDTLGGTVGVLKNEPLCGPLGEFADYLITQMERRGVDVRLQCAATADDILALRPDVVLLATGSTPTIPPKAADNPKVLDILQALRERDKIGQRVIIWGHAYGSETAVSLGEEGKDVTLFDNGGKDTLLGFASDARRFWLMKKLADVDPVRVHEGSRKADNVTAYFNTKVGEITEESVELKHKDGTTQRLAYDTLIIARARKRDNELSAQLEGKVPQLHEIGDCKEVRTIHRAVFGANEVVRAI